jgi:hypothetical protein
MSWATEAIDRLHCRMTKRLASRQMLHAHRQLRFAPQLGSRHGEALAMPISALPPKAEMFSLEIEVC